MVATLRQTPAKRSPLRSNAVDIVSMTVGAEATNVITVACVFKNANARAVAQRCGLMFYLASDSTGQTPDATGSSGGIAAGTNGKMLAIVANKLSLGVCKADGTLDVAITDTGTPTFYLVAILPDGTLAVSGAITFT